MKNRRKPKSRKQRMLDKIERIPPKDLADLTPDMPRYGDTRDEFVKITFNCDTWNINPYDAGPIITDAFEGIVPSRSMVTFVKLPHLGVVLKMHWGDYHEDITADVYDTIVGYMRTPLELATDTSTKRYRMFNEAMRADDGKHPVYGDVILWAMGTLAKTHPVRQAAEEQHDWQHTQVMPLKHILEAIITVEAGITAVTGEEFFATYGCNHTNLLAELMMVREDIVA